MASEHTAEVFKDSAGEWRYRIKAANHEIVAEGESYSTKEHAIRGVEDSGTEVSEVRVLSGEAGE